MNGSAHRGCDVTCGALRFAKINLIYPELARSPLLLASLTSDGVLQLVSQGWSRALGWPVEELAGKHLVDFIDPEEAEHATALLQCQDGAKAHGHVSFALIGRDGTRRRFDWNSCLDDYDGITYILGAEKDGNAHGDGSLGQKPAIFRIDDAVTLARD